MTEDRKNLRKLVEEANSLELMLVENGGEVTAEIEKLLELKDVQLPAKVDRYNYFMERMAFLSQEYYRQAEPLLKIADTLKKLADRAEDNLKQTMISNDTLELLGFDIKFKLTHAKASVVVTDESKVPQIYKKTKTTETVDKTSILEDYKLGVKIEGVEVRPSFSLRKYANLPIKKGDGNE